ncbi:piggyBac transposable element-derived protein 4 [Trichonephila clavipes]|nr:piggyBac transposable element-derived protein 4 [Trichonephila clavipes]
MLETPFFRTVMPRDRFLNLLRYLHFEDNNNVPDKTALDYDRLWKLRYVFDSLNNSFQNIYNPSEELAIDEVIVSFKGRVIFKQYIPKKRKRFGIKLYKVVDKKGYTFNMKVYLGCDKKRNKSDLKMTSTHATVLELAECVKDKGHKLFMDNLFSSPALFQQLYIEYKINSCGTMRPNRKNYPKKLACPKMKKGDLSVKFGCGMRAMCWKDKREVFMLSNMHDPDMSTSTLCNDRCEKPGLVTSYNTNMGFVDLNDRMANSYTFGRKTLKWTKKLFFHLLDLTVLNAFILYKIKTGNNICHKIFRLNLIRQLLQNENIETIITSPQRNARNNRPENKHWPGCKKVQRRCAMCKSKGMTRRTSVSCKLCNVGLCVNCFEEYHTN